ncbi:MAG: heavy metal-associated domain-containing protein [Alphaproteobacteria bacterium]|nr:heavy metal-associated domain-containing protein [Alphaproteobacteria bacterium]
MRRFLYAVAMAMSVAGNAVAADVQYDLRIDGITCPFCVATSASALEKMEGVKKVDVNLKEGILRVCADEKTSFSDAQLKELFAKKGFTYRGMDKHGACEAA